MAAALIFAALYPGRQAAHVQAGRGIPLPVLMYHSVTLHPSRMNEYTVLAQQLAEDLAYLRPQGYDSVVISDLLGYVASPSPRPMRRKT